MTANQNRTPLEICAAICAGLATESGISLLSPMVRWEVPGPALVGFVCEGWRIVVRNDGGWFDGIHSAISPCGQFWSAREHAKSNGDRDIEWEEMSELPQRELEDRLLCISDRAVIEAIELTQVGAQRCP